MIAIVYVTVKLKVVHDDPKDKHTLNDELISDMDYDFSTSNKGYAIVDTELIESEVVELNVEEG